MLQRVHMTGFGRNSSLSLCVEREDGFFPLPFCSASSAGHRVEELPPTGPAATWLSERRFHRLNWGTSPPQLRSLTSRSECTSSVCHRLSLACRSVYNTPRGWRRLLTPRQPPAHLRSVPSSEAGRCPPGAGGVCPPGGLAQLGCCFRRVASVPGSGLRQEAAGGKGALREAGLSHSWAKSRKPHITSSSRSTVSLGLS